MSFIVYDLIFLILFLIFFSLFLYTKRKNLKKDGLLFLYRSKWGINLINSIGKKYKKTLKVLSYVSIFCGYLLMIGALYLIYGVVKIYILNPAIVRAVKIPPILPLFPYLPQVFNLNFLPPFYFTYWIIIIAIIAISHEMAHGILMRRYNVKIKSTGFAFFPYFFPIFPAAFVEQDEKSMEKSTKFHQLSILSAGTFANLITTFVFLAVLIGFFSLAFAPAGVVYDTYATAAIPISGISMINGMNVSNVSYQQLLNSTVDNGFNNITLGNMTYLTTKSTLQSQQTNNDNFIIVYYNSPAIKDNLSSIITGINGVNVNSVAKLQTELSKYKPGANISITELVNSGAVTKYVVLEPRPDNPNVAWLGIGFFSNQPSNFGQEVVSWFSSFKSPNVYYQPVLNSDMSVFIYNLLLWIIIISISVALINMLPVGIFDGGRFFYLTVLGITRSESVAKKAFKFTTWLFLFILVVLMVFWFISI